MTGLSSQITREKLIYLIGVIFSGIYVYQTVIIPFSPHLNRGLFVLFTILLGVLCKPSNLRKPFGAVYDALVALGGIVSVGYYIYYYPKFIMKMGMPLSSTDIFMGVLLTVVVLIICTRFVGWSLTAVGLAGLIYLFFGQYFSGVLGHAGFTINRIMTRLYTSTEGIFGMVVGVFASFVLLFIVFGAVLEKFGAVDAFLDLARAVFRKSTGGTAKAAVLSSALLGMVMGSGAANAVITGTVTIPLMKASGYKDYEAAAVEAVASSGGQILPPVMGAGAFLLASIIGVPYIEVVYAASIPAILLYISVYCYVHYIAKKRKYQLKGKEVGVEVGTELVPVKQAMRESAPHFLSILVMLGTLIIGFTPGRAAIWAMVTVLLVDLIKKRKPVDTIKRAVDSLAMGARNVLVVASVAGVVGILIVAVTMPGLAGQFAYIVIKYSAGKLFLACLLIMFTSVVLGIGLGEVATYLIVAVLGGPALMEFGVPAMQAHLFIFWTSIISNFTPPVCVASYAAASVAKADPNRTAFEGCRLAWPFYVIPFLIIYVPSITLLGTLPEIVFNAVTLGLAVWYMSVAIVGFFSRPANLAIRLLLFASAVLISFNGVVLPVIGTCLGAMILFILNKKSGPDVAISG